MAAQILRTGSQKDLPFAKPQSIQIGPLASIIEMNRPHIRFLFMNIGFILLLNSCQGQSGKTYEGMDLEIEHPTFQYLIPVDQNIYWLGEQHGTKKNYEVAYKYLRHLVDSIGIDYILIENSYLTEILLNKYLRTGDEIFLNRSISNYQNIYYANLELKGYLKKVYALNLSLPERRKFTFVSIDIEQTYTASIEFVRQQLIREDLQNDFEAYSEVKKMKEEESWLAYYSELSKFLDQQQAESDTLRYMARNLEALLYTYKYGESWDEIRDSLIFENFKIRDMEFDFKKKRCFAFWGSDHCYKYQNKDDVAWIASLIAKHRQDIDQNSTTILYKGCKFMQSKGMFPKASRFLFQRIDDNFICHSYQNEPFQGLRDKRYLEKNRIESITMWKVDELDPTWNFVTRKSKIRTTKDYLDNVILILDSDCCTPYY